MKKEVRVLNEKSRESLILAIEHFNRPTETGRAEVVLIMLDRAFELLLKSCLVHRGARIREPRAKETIGFDKCVRKCLSDGSVKCLTDEQALTLQIINSLRDAAQHYILEISEQQLYMFAQAGLTLYKELSDAVLEVDLDEELPSRVLPVTTSPPQSLSQLIDAEFAEIKKLLRPKSRKRLDAKAKLRSLAIIEASVTGVRSQPGEAELKRLIGGITRGTRWQTLFPGVASMNLDTEGSGLTVSIRLAKSKGEPVLLVPEGTPGATVVAVKRVDELGFYSLGLTQLAKKLRMTMPKTLALVRHQKIQDSEDCYKEMRVGKSTFKRYSAIALDRLKSAIQEVDMEEVWLKHGSSRGAA